MDMYVLQIKELKIMLKYKTECWPGTFSSPKQNLPFDVF